MRNPPKHLEKRRKRRPLTGFLLAVSLLELAVIVYLLLPSGQGRAETAAPPAEAEPLRWEQPMDQPQPPAVSQLNVSVLPAAKAPAESDQDAEEAEEPAVQEKTKPAGELSAAEILANSKLAAHGMGSIGGLTTPNCVESFLAQYEAGIRVFEVDLRLTRDAKNVLRHDWWNASWQSGIDWARIPTRDKFLSEKILDNYTPLSFRDLLQLMEVYPDVCVITDTKFTESDVFTIQFDSMLADARELGLTYLFDRIAIQVYSGNMRTGLHNIYPFPHYIYTLYQDEDFTGTKDSFRERAAYCAKHGIKGIAIDQHWWNPAFASIADEYGIQLYVHTVNDAATAKKLLDAGCDAVYTDSLTPAQLS